MNVHEILGKTTAWLSGKGLESARLEAELLLAHVLGTDRVGLYVDRERPLIEEEIDAYRDLVRRRASGEPVAYLTGKREFYGLEFAVSPAVLVPRPETEMLVDRARELEPARLLDLGTGSGCIAITCAVRLPECVILATDVSEAALELARANAAAHGVEDRVTFRRADLFEGLGDEAPFDLIVSNPPYVAEGDAPEVAAHEPHLALFSGPEGLDALRRILADAPAHLVPGGTLLTEIGEDQEDAVLAFAGEHFERAYVHRDLSGLPRVMETQSGTG